MLYKGVFITDASGSVDGATFSRNRGGPYIRARTIPIDPDTAEQEAVRSAMSSLATAWNENLDPAGRDAWSRYASSHTYPNRIGDQRRLTGRAEFFRANLLRRQAGIWLGITFQEVDAPSTIGPHIAPGRALSVGVDDPSIASFNLSWNAADHPWPDADDACLVYISGPQPRTVNFFRSPYTLFAAVRGDEVAPVAFPASALAPLLDGMRYFWRVRVNTGDGRLSMPITGHLDI